MDARRFPGKTGGGENPRPFSLLKKARRAFFDRLLDFLKRRKSFKKSFDSTRKKTLTVFFHTFFPSGAFGRHRFFDSLSGHIRGMCPPSVKERLVQVHSSNRRR